jgi:hypothetical protein
MSDVVGTPTRFSDAIRRNDARGREVETAMAMHLEPFVIRNKLHVNDILRGLMGNVVAIIFARAADHADAIEGAELLIEELRRRVRDVHRSTGKRPYHG